MSSTPTLYNVSVTTGSDEEQAAVVLAIAGDEAAAVTRSIQIAAEAWHVPMQTIRVVSSGLIPSAFVGIASNGLPYEVTITIKPVKIKVN